MQQPQMKIGGDEFDEIIKTEENVSANSTVFKVDIIEIKYIFFNIELHWENEMENQNTILQRNVV